jgi:hypothetical protein
LTIDAVIAIVLTFLAGQDHLHSAFTERYPAIFTFLDEKCFTNAKRFAVNGDRRPKLQNVPFRPV